MTEALMLKHYFKKAKPNSLTLPLRKVLEILKLLLAYRTIRGSKNKQMKLNCGK